MKIVYHISVSLPSTTDKGKTEEVGSITPYLSSSLSSRKGDIQGAGSDNEQAARTTVASITAQRTCSCYFEGVVFSGTFMHALHRRMADAHKDVFLVISAVKMSVENPGSFVTAFKMEFLASLFSIIPQDKGYEVNFNNVDFLDDMTPELNEDEKSSLAKRFKEASNKIAATLIAARLQEWFYRNKKKHKMW